MRRHPRPLATQLADAAERALVVASVLLILTGAYLVLGALLEVTSADAAISTDSGFRPVVTEPTPEPIPASLLWRSRP